MRSLALVEVADLSAELRERAPVATVVVVHEGHGVSVVCEDVMNLDVERLKAGDHPAEERQDLVLAPVGASVRAASGHVPHDVVGEGIRCVRRQRKGCAPADNRTAGGVRRGTVPP